MENNTPSGELVVEEISFAEDGNDITDEFDYTVEDFVQCCFSYPSRGSLHGYGDQENRSATVTIDLEADSEAMTIDLDWTAISSALAIETEFGGFTLILLSFTIYRTRGSGN